MDEQQELKLVGAMLLDSNKLWEAVANWIFITEIKTEKAQRIYRVMRLLYEKWQPTDVPNVAQQLKAYEMLDKIGWEQFLWDLCADSLDTTQYKSLMKEILHKEFEHITYKDKLLRAVNELKATDPNKIIKRWWQERDDLLWGIYKWKIYTIWAPTWTWKTTFVNAITKNVSMQGWKVIRYSLEDRMEDQWKEELYDEVNRLRHKDGLWWYKRTKFVNNEYNDETFWNYMREAYKKLSKLEITELDKDKAVSIDDLVELMEKACDNWADMFVIDHLHYFDMDNSERHDLQIQNVMHRINEIVRKRNVAVFLVAHYRNYTDKENPDPSDFKDWAAIKQVSNVIIQITKAEEDITIFKITKIRGRIIWDRDLRCEFNKETWEYSFSKTEQQQEKEQAFNL